MARFLSSKGKPLAKIYTRGGSDKLQIEYWIGSKRVRKSTGFDDTPANRKTLLKEVIPKLMARIASGETEPKSTKTFKHYFNEWLKLKKCEKSYEMKLYTRNKVCEHFGSSKVDEITRLQIKQYLNELNVKEASKRLYLSTIKGVLDTALDDEAVEKNIAIGIEFKKEDKAEVKPFTPEEVKMILDNADCQLKNYLGIAFYTGMRSGEILGLMRHDVDNWSISIKRSISKGKITTPKTKGSTRTIPLFDAAKPFIEDQLKSTSSLYLFHDENGQPIKDISILRKRKWHRLLSDCGIEYRKIYNTRHTFITAMLNSGRYKLMTIAEIVGHSTIDMIVSNYAGFIKDSASIDKEIDIFSTGTNVAQSQKV